MIGNIDIFLEALGTRRGDSHILSAIAIIADGFEIYSSQFNNLIFYKFLDRGVEFSFDEEDILNSIFFFCLNTGEYKKYPFLDDLIYGLGNSPSKDTVNSILGIADISSGNYLKYQINGKFIHFEFDEVNNLKLISIFLPFD